MVVTQTCSAAKGTPELIELAGGVAASGPSAIERHNRELVWNHLWESCNAGAKILLFAVLTPIMLANWGTANFGLFAVANSCVALMAVVDLGLRLLTRRGLSDSLLSESGRARLRAVNLLGFLAAAGVTIAIIGALALGRCWHRWLNLPPVADSVIVTTALLTALTMSLQLLFEPIAAAGRLSQVKALLFAGNVLAFAVVLLLLAHNAAVATTIAAYYAALALPLLLFLPFARLEWVGLLRAISNIRGRELMNALGSGRWLNLITASWIGQSYGLVFLVSWLLGPAAAGTFFLYLKLAELLGVLGASASEPTIAAVAGATTLLDRKRHFATSYRSAVVLCLAGASAYAFFTGELFQYWLHRPADQLYIGLLIGLFGIATGFTRIVAAGSIAVDRARSAALAMSGGALLLVAALVAFHKHGLEVILLAGVCSPVLLVPTAREIAREVGSTSPEMWIGPIRDFLPALVIICSVHAVAASTGSLVFTGVALAISALVALRYLFKTPRKHADPESLLGYDTRSWRSAIVMRAVDLVRPWRRAEPFAWSSPCVVSSVAGLGDLFVHLPLIAGIVNEARRRNVDVHVALRPVHLEIGRVCGWNVLPFDNALEDFFKNVRALQLVSLARQSQRIRRRHINLWIDLTGSAVSACAIKWAGARKIASRMTRGGASLVNHPLPHEPQENEYANVHRVATTLDVALDHSVFENLRGSAQADYANTVVLCLTTAYRWKSWPLENFRTLTEIFPEVPFALTGLRREIASDEEATFDRLLRQSNVINRMDEGSVLSLIALIAHARAVITNDTSAAHIANAFGIPGAVLFGPTSPRKWGSECGLKSFVDSTCPFHPCVQWTCRNQENWCMRKISVEAVVSHLASVLATSEAYAATANIG